MKTVATSLMFTKQPTYLLALNNNKHIRNTPANHNTIWLWLLKWFRKSKSNLIICNKCVALKVDTWRWRSYTQYPSIHLATSWSASIFIKHTSIESPWEVKSTFTFALNWSGRPALAQPGNDFISQVFPWFNMFLWLATWLLYVISSKRW